MMFLIHCSTGSRINEAEAIREIRADRLAAQVRFLADDLLEGRGTGTRGYDLAALYMATQFQEIGLSPAGDPGSFLQQVPLRKTLLVQEESSLTFVTKKGQVKLKYNVDFVMGDDYARPETSVSADAVFVGFGITAPELQYDDYANADVKGKIVVIL